MGKLEDDDTLSQEQHQQAAMIRLQSERIKELIENLNLASKLEYGAYPLSLMHCSPAVLIRKTAVSYLNHNGEALSVILYCNLILSIGNTGINLNGTTIGIVTNAVADEILSHRRTSW